MVSSSSSRLALRAASGIRRSWLTRAASSRSGLRARAAVSSSRSSRSRRILVDAVGQGGQGLLLDGRQLPGPAVEQAEAADHRSVGRVDGRRGVEPHRGERPVDDGSPWCVVLVGVRHDEEAGQPWRGGTARARPAGQRLGARGDEVVDRRAVEHAESRDLDLAHALSRSTTSCRSSSPTCPSTSRARLFETPPTRPTAAPATAATFTAFPPDPLGCPECWRGSGERQGLWGIPGDEQWRTGLDRSVGAAERHALLLAWSRSPQVSDVRAFRSSRTSATEA